MIKNVIVVNDYAYINGGAGKVAIMSAIALANVGLNVYFFCGKGPVCKELNESQVRVVSVEQGEITAGGKVKGFVQGINNREAEKKLLSLVNDINRGDTVLHFHAWSKILSSSIFKVGKKAGVPIVVTGHDYGTVCPNGCFYDFRNEHICTYKPLGMKCISCNCDKKGYVFKLFRIIRQAINRSFISGNNLHYVYISEFSKAMIKQNLVWPAGEHFVLNPIDVDFVKKADVANNVNFIFVGRVSAEKGIPYFCEAMSMAKQKGIVIGDGPILEELKQRYPNIEFVGWKNSDEITEYALSAKALIFPSVWYEAAPLTIPEMMGKYELPCIVSDLCAGKDYIDDGINGYVFKGGDIESLVQKINLVICNCVMIQDNIERSFDREQYKMSTHAENLIVTYNRILSEGK